VKVLFDTSVLVAAMVVNHPRHAVCLPWLEAVKAQHHAGAIATHTLAEVYAVLTRLPLSPRISADLAQRLIVENWCSLR
jgi:predicted nucleic acid-binding protein